MPLGISSVLTATAIAQLPIFILRTITRSRLRAATIGPTMSSEVFEMIAQQSARQNSICTLLGRHQPRRNCGYIGHHPGWEALPRTNRCQLPCHTAITLSAASSDRTSLLHRRNSQCSK